MSERGPEQPAGWSAPGSDGAPPEIPRAEPGQDPPTGSGWDRPPQYGASSGAPPYGAPPYGAPPYGAPLYGGAQQGGHPGWAGPPAAPRPGVVPLRPLGLGELLDGSVAVVRRYPRPTLGLSLAVSLLLTVVGVLLVLLLPTAVFTGSGSGLDGAQAGGTSVGSLVAVPVDVLLGLVLSGMITVVVGRAVLGRTLTTAEAWATLRPRLGGLVLLTLATLGIVLGVFVVAVAVAVGCALALGPAGLVLSVPLAICGTAAAVYLYVRLSLAGPALVLEKLRVREALRRSGVLVRHSFWRVFGVLLLAALIAGIVAAVLRVPFAVFAGTDVLTGTATGTTGRVLAQIGTGIAQTLTAPFSAGVTALLYVDRRMRAEGLDMVLAASTQAGAQAGSGSDAAPAAAPR